ncbi:bd-type cytochrome oxidase subunit II [Primorskyibacter sedentarius]|uniref:Bd-type cytochrome oxidase subunit II n=2 Tax=Primorskyibacter sedentarius TaxID=745311 RepID=A0A4R3INB5_9RHOB|nr:bd-type cytochrome oxidase subunit II [Primorskyibacter sedentarius]
MALGALVQGITTEGRAYAGGNWDWLTPFSSLTALALLVGYAMLGATWLIVKTEGETLECASRFARPLGVALLVLIGAISLITPLQQPEYLLRWFGWPSGLWSAIVPVLLGFTVWQLWKGLRDGDHFRPFLASVAVFVLCYAGLGISFYPNLVPPSLTIAAAAAPDSSLAFLLVGAAVLIPTILATRHNPTGCSEAKFDQRMDTTNAAMGLVCGSLFRRNHDAGWHRIAHSIGIVLTPLCERSAPTAMLKKAETQICEDRNLPKLFTTNKSGKASYATEQ